VPADAFYEWVRLDAKRKQPFAIAMKDGKPYALAGLWERWKDRKAGTELLTFTVITTEPHEVVEQLHDRMPCIIPEKDYDRWLKQGDPDSPAHRPATAFRRRQNDGVEGGQSCGQREERFTRANRARINHAQ
jgi:putative SOS response-associated peptidase YedK